MIKALYKSFAAARFDRLVYRATPDRLRILNYHAVCEDRFAQQGWVPPYFVTRSAFESQLAYLQRHTCVLPLDEAVARLRDKNLPKRCVAITFDDGYANNLHVALPLLQKYKLPATIFLTTGYIESGTLFHYDRIQLIRFLQGRTLNDDKEDFWFGYGTQPLDAVLEHVQVEWSKVESRLSPEQRDTLRPLSLDELLAFDPKLVDFGSHTDRHPILSAESSAVREWEISTSIQKLKQWTGRSVRLFSYPNGDPGDFGELDKQVLRARGVEAAFSTIAGTNQPGGDLYELRRYGVGLNHSISSFIAELTGFRTFLASLVHGSSRVHPGSVT